jgi:hypothetical protein
VSAVYGAAADVEGGTIPGIGGEGFDGNGGADDIGDCVLGADLVKVDGLGMAIVNLGLGLGEELESSDSEALCGGADGGAGDDLADLFESTVDVGRLVV